MSVTPPRRLWGFPLHPSERKKLEFIKEHVRMSDKPQKPDVNDPSNSAVKPGWQSTEFALSAIAAIVGLLLMSGVFSPEDPKSAQILQILGAISSLLAALGYTVPRSKVKQTAIEGAAAIAIEKVRASVPQSPSEPPK